MRRVVILVAAGLSGCMAVPAAMALGEAIIEGGQLVCKVGTAYEAMQSSSGSNILAKNATAEAVIDVCNLVNGAPAALPTASTPVVPVQVSIPLTVTIPLAPVT